MYYYFYGNKDFAIKINGMYLGIISSSIQHVKVDFLNAYVELCPLNSQDNGISFLLNDEFLKNPPSAISVTDLKGGYLISYFAPKRNQPFKIFSQKNVNGINTTVYCDGENKISIEKHDDFYINSLGIDFLDAEIFYLNDSVIILAKDHKNKLITYSTTPKIKQISILECDQCEINSTIKVINKFSNVQKHCVTTEYSINNGELCLINKNVDKSDNFSINKINKKIIPYAFLDEFLVSKKVNDYLTDEVLKNADKLDGYLGGYLGVMPPPFFRNPDEIGLIYQQKFNVYKVEYFTFSLDDRKICNINKLEQ